MPDAAAQGRTGGGADESATSRLIFVDERPGSGTQQRARQGTRARAVDLAARLAADRAGDKGGGQDDAE